MCESESMRWMYGPTCAVAIRALPTPPATTVCVPREPTEAMLKAGNVAHGEYLSAHQRSSNAWDGIRAIYRAMLSAAQIAQPLPDAATTREGP